MRRSKSSDGLRLGAALALLLGGCSSGGGGGSGETAATLEGITLGGTVAKGVAASARIEVWELDGNGTPLATVGTATSDASGRYSLTLENYGGGPLRLTATIGDASTLRCDAASGCGPRGDDLDDDNGQIDFGEWYVPAPFSLEALLPPLQAGQMAGASLTPFTHMAARRVAASGRFDATTIANANSEVAVLLGGIDLLNTEPADITAPPGDTSPTALAYGALAGAVAEAAPRDGAGRPDIEVALAQLGTAFENGRFPADDTGSARDGELISLRELIDATRAVLTAAARVDTSGVLAVLETEVAAATDSDGDGVTDLDPEPSPSAADPELAKVKGLMADLRTWGQVIDLEAGAPERAFRQQIDLALESAETINELLIEEILYLSAKAIANYHSTDEGLHLYKSFGVVSPRWPEGFSRGLIKNPSPGVFEITGAALEPVAAGGDYLTLDLTARVPYDGESSDTYTLGITSATIAGPYAEGRIRSGTFTLRLSEPYTVNTLESVATVEDALLPLVEAIDLQIDLELTQKWDMHGTAIANQGGDPVNIYYPDPVTFSGVLTSRVHPYVETVAGRPKVTFLTPATLYLSGSASNSGDRVEATFAANFPNAATFVPGSPDTETVDNWIAFDASPDATDTDLGIGFSLQLEGLPEARINISADRTGLEAGDVTLTIVYSSRRLDIEASGDARAGTITSEVVVTNQDGARLTLDLQQAGPSGTLSYNGRVYANLERTAGGLIKINYIDGTFEIF